MCVAPTEEQLVELANGLAAEAAKRGDPPFGAVLVSPHGEVVALASNREISTGDPTAHAEIVLLRAAEVAGFTPPLSSYTMATNAEPCPMCASAIAAAGVGRLVVGSVVVGSVVVGNGVVPPRHSADVDESEVSRPVDP